MKALYGILLVVACVALIGCPPATSPAKIVVTNDSTASNILEFHLVDVDAADWGANLLPWTIPAGNTYTVRGIYAGRYDISVVVDDVDNATTPSQAYTIFNVNVEEDTVYSCVVDDDSVQFGALKSAAVATPIAAE